MGRGVRVQIVGKGLSSMEVVVTGCFEKEQPQAEGLPAKVRTATLQAIDRRGFKGSFAQTAMTRSSAPGRPFVSVVGLGPRSELDLFRYVEWLRRVTSRLVADGFRRVAVRLPEQPAGNTGETALCVLRTLRLAGYRFDDFRKKRKGGARLKLVGIVPAPGEEAAYRSVARLAREIAAGSMLCRDLANSPPNLADPEWMTEKARELATTYGMDVDVLGPEELESKGMGGILAVGGGSARPPRLVRLAWGESGKTVALVGKGITFDTGGISLKPPATMDEMKFDKSGACAVLGIARALAGANVPGKFRCYLALAENMPGGRAYRPGDIVRCYNGKTVEILNTDAEGRMVLADALSWAEEEKPQVMIDFATLTGACVVALGLDGAGLFTPSDELSSQLLSAADAAAERLWRMPLWPEFERQMRGQHGDLRNVSGRWGGASTAAAFLSQFVEHRSRWAHVDLAGPAAIGRSDKSRFGATGYGVALTCTWLMRRAGLL